MKGSHSTTAVFQKKDMGLISSLKLTPSGGYAGGAERTERTEKIGNFQVAGSSSVAGSKSG